VVVTNSANASSTGKIFTILFFNHFSSLARTPYLLVAEETLVDQTVGSSSLHHDSVPVSPRIQLASPQLEVSASPRNHPVSPQPAVQEPSIELEKPPSPIRETRNDVSMRHPSFLFSPNRSSLIRQEFLFRRKPCHHPVIPLLWMTWLEKGDEASSSQALSEENQAKLKEILSLSQRDIQDQVRDADLLREALEFIESRLP
jgi:hypothetical protein